MRFVVFGGLATVSFAAIICACTAAGSTILIGPEGGLPTGDGGGGGDAKPVGKPDSSTPLPTDYEALFGPPDSPDTTPNSIFGLWAGMSSNGQDMRIVFSATGIVLALKCSTTGTGSTVGGSVAATVSNASIKVVESKTIGSTSSGCGIAITPTQLPQCGSSSSTCFTLSGTDLYLGYALGASGTFTKLSD